MTQPALIPDLLLTLPGMVSGIVGRDPWRVQCSECGRIGQHPRYLSAAIADGGIHFHASPWPDGSNPRLCAACRVTRACDCFNCNEERRWVA